MTMTEASSLDRLEALVARMEAMGVIPRVGIEPLAFGDMAPHVAAGELIESAWGNAVVDELERQRAEQFVNFTHNGVSGVPPGNYDLGTTVLGPWTYPVRITLWGVMRFGFAIGDASAALAVYRLSDGAVLNFHPPGMAHGERWADLTAWFVIDVPIGEAGSFKSTAEVVAVTNGVCHASFGGFYHVQRTGDP